MDYNKNFSLASNAAMAGWLLMIIFAAIYIIVIITLLVQALNGLPLW